LPRPVDSRSTATPEKFLGGSYNAAYAPDGRKIAFESRRGGQMAIWGSDADGSGQAQLTRSKAPSGTPRWSPDGRRIVFDSLEAGNWDLYVIDPQGGVPRRTTRESSDDGKGSWSRDGRFIYFSSDRRGGPQIWKIPAEGGPAVQVSRDGGWYAMESQDGRDVYYSKSDTSGIWRMPVSGGSGTEVVKEAVHWMAWALGREGLYYATIEGDILQSKRSYAIRYLAFANRRATTLFRKDVGRRSFLSLTVSPDEQWILFGEAPPFQAELMLVENFR
jgi:Tol biopolymer transport system component